MKNVQIISKEYAWMDNYLELKERLNSNKSIHPRLRGWLNYQPYRRTKLSPHKIELLDELIPLMGFDWKKKNVKVKRKSRKRSEVKGLGKRIRATRIDKGFASISEFIENTSLSYSSVNDWENEVSIPSLDRLIILCEKLNVSADYLLFGKNKK